jgi:transposase
VIALDNYSVHKSQIIQEAIPALEAADVYLFSLPSYTPELSGIEPVWNDVKYREMTRRSHKTAGELKRAVDDALKRKADKLLACHSKTAILLQRAA